MKKKKDQDTENQEGSKIRKYMLFAVLPKSKPDRQIKSGHNSSAWTMFILFKFSLLFLGLHGDSQVRSQIRAVAEACTAEPQQELSLCTF